MDVIFEERNVVMVAIRMTNEGVERRDKLAAEGRCLGCAGKISGEPVRGLCKACYSALRRAIAKNKAKAAQMERRLIKEGKLLRPSKGGRPSSNPFTKALADD